MQEGCDDMLTLTSFDLGWKSWPVQIKSCCYG